MSYFVPFLVRIPNNSIKLIFWKLSVLALGLTSGYSQPKGRAQYNWMMISLCTGLSSNHHQVHRKLKFGCDLRVATLDLALAKTHNCSACAVPAVTVLVWLQPCVGQSHRRREPTQSETVYISFLGEHDGLAAGGPQHLSNHESQ